MKRFLFAIALALLLFVTACGKTKPAGPSEADLAVAEEISVWVLTVVPNKTLDDLELPTTHPELGGTIEWLSFDDDLITSDGLLLNLDGPKEAMLSYTIKYNDVVKIDYINVSVAGISLDDVAELFKKQFSLIITRDYDLRTTYYSDYEVEWTSSNVEVFDNDGKFIRPLNEELITINFTVKYGDKVEQYSHEVRVQGMVVSDKIKEVDSWIKTEFLSEKLIQSEIDLPTRYEKYDANISWSSSNYNVVSDEGKITRYAFDRYVTLRAKIEMDETYNEVDYSLVIAKKDITNQKEKMESFLNAIAVEKLPKITFEYYSNISNSYNFLPFFDSIETPIVEKLTTNPNARSFTKMTSVEFITIHDTANQGSTAGASMHATYLINLNERYVSWHFAVDENGAYNSIPLDEVSWHAGDGSRVYNMLKTNVVATTKYPVLTVSSKGYYAFNGVESNIKVPLAGSRMAVTSDLTPSGIYTEIGEDGYYYINSTHWDGTYLRIAQDGGNRNSISFETCVNAGGDYFMTIRHAANITADLVIEHGLNVDRIMQHNNYSGKDCPLAMRRTGYWNNYLDLVSLLIYGRENFANYNFVWTSNSPSLLDNGQILRNATYGSVLNYAVIVTNKTNPAETYAKSFSTTLK